MKLLALLCLSVVALAAKDIREVRFPFADEKEMAAFIAQTEPQLDGEVQQRVWRNGVAWLREYCESKRIPFLPALRGQYAPDMLLRGYGEHIKMLADQIEELAKQARETSGEEAARLKARAADLSKSRDAISEETSVLFPKHRTPPAGESLHTEPPH